MNNHKKDIASLVLTMAMVISFSPTGMTAQATVREPDIALVENSFKIEGDQYSFQIKSNGRNNHTGRMVAVVVPNFGGGASPYTVEERVEAGNWNKNDQLSSDFKALGIENYFDTGAPYAIDDKATQSFTDWTTTVSGCLNADASYDKLLNAEWNKGPDGQPKRTEFEYILIVNCKSEPGLHTAKFTVKAPGEQSVTGVQDEQTELPVMTAAALAKGAALMLPAFMPMRPLELMDLIANLPYLTQI